MIATDMKQLLDSMENSIKLQGRTRAEKRARRAEQEQEEFREKLMRIAASQVELDGMAAKKRHGRSRSEGSANWADGWLLGT